jgi:hypothetical protein
MDAHCAQSRDGAGTHPTMASIGLILSLLAVAATARAVPWD